MGYAGENRKPTPTEYKGVRFRSKSEAVFARCLDLAGWDWDYEPGVYESNPVMSIHPWDFLISRDEYWGESTSSVQMLIEYKPSRPSNQYVRNTRQGARDFLDNRPGRHRLYWLRACGLYPSIGWNKTGKPDLFFDRQQIHSKHFAEQLPMIRDNAEKIVECLLDENRPIDCALVFGSPWEPASSSRVYDITPLLSNIGGRGGFLQIFDESDEFLFDPPAWDFLRITKNMAEDAKQYRFDLR